MPHGEQKVRPQSILRTDSDQRGGDAASLDGGASPGSYLGMRHDQSPRRTPSNKSVSIAHEPEVISPLILGDHKQVDSDCDLDRPSPRKFSTRGPASKRLSGRLPDCPTPLFKQASSLSINSINSDYGEGEESEGSSHRRFSSQHLDSFIDQVSQWIKHERSKRSDHETGPSETNGQIDGKEESARGGKHRHHPSFDLDRLEDIIKSNLSLDRRSRHNRNRSPRRKSSIIKAQRKQSIASDTESTSYEGETLVATCDVVLDNSNTLSYTGGASSDSDSSDDELERTSSYRDVDAWAKFKFEIVRLTHTLRLKGWSRVAMNMSNKISVERLSGALTNAVYVVSPPSNLTPRGEDQNGNAQVDRKKPPPKLLLRVYGPQVDHLIDRQSELAILRRLCKKNIGPRLLGTFANGRFEEYLNAKPLTPEDLRNPDTSRQIAKRMRELHDGIDLLDQERDDGPFVFRNWDKWVRRVEKVVSWLDCEVMRLKPGVKPTGAEAWKRRGYILGVPWKQFRSMVEKHRAWLEDRYGGPKALRKQLVFAHNDTQYGNILRLMPTGESPLLLPANTHKRLIVIDFEYSNANLPGQEFANHFTEWCYNYHDERKPYAFHSNWYPTPEEQDRFIRAYVRHRPQFNVSTPKMQPSSPRSTPAQPGEGLSRRPTSSISDFMLDARAPAATSSSSSSLHLQNEEKACKEKEDRDVARLLHETRMWRLANTAQWVAWGIVQAAVPGMPKFDDDEVEGKGPAADDDAEAAAREDLGEEAEVYRHLTAQQEEDVKGADGAEMKEEAEEEFDYLGYAQHRAMFCWADAIHLGLVKAEELPEETREKIKVIAY